MYFFLIVLTHWRVGATAKFLPWSEKIVDPGLIVCCLKQKFFKDLRVMSLRTYPYKYAPINILLHLYISY